MTPVASPAAPAPSQSDPASAGTAHAPFDLAGLMASADAPIELMDRHINPAMVRVLRVLGYDADYVRGEAQYLYDAQGRRYLDCVGGFGTFACGRNHPTIRGAIKQAMDLDLPNLPKFGVPRLSGLLAQQLLEIAPGELDKVYFSNSGTESVETAMKYARAATGRNRLIFCAKAYHGLTLGALSINGGGEFRDGFGRLLEDVTRIPFNDLPALEKELATGDVAGFIVEPIQGKGVAIPSDDYLPEAARLCKKHGAVFVADEVQTGFGRTGKMFACEHWGVEPDILACSKALSGGHVPVGAVLSKEWIHRKVFTGMDKCMVHSTTFTGNDLAMAAGLATLHVLRSERLIENAHAMGERLIAGLRALQPKYEMLKEVRGKGMMIALEFGEPRSLRLKPGWALLHRLDESLFPQAVLIPLIKEHRILAQVAGHHQDVIKLLPPLVITPGDVDHLVAAFDDTIGACHKFPGPAWEIAKQLGQFVLKR